MRLNTANRSFALVVAVAAAPYGVLALAGCGLAVYLADRVSTGGMGELTHGLLLPTTLMLGLLAVGAVAGAWSAARQVAATRRLIQHVTLVALAPSAGSPPDVDVVDHDDPFAFTFGLGTPRIALSRGLVEQLTPVELEAVVAHERYHLRARDPLKLVIARVAGRTCFFLPAVRHLAARYVAGRELAADRRALRDRGQSALAGALFKVVSGPGWDELHTAAAMAGPELLAVRVDQLERGAEPPLPPLPTAAVTTSALVLGVLIAVVATVALQGGLSMATAGDSRVSAIDVGAAIAGGLVCAGGWVWLAVRAFRHIALPALANSEA